MNLISSNIPLYWYRENREGKGIENFGDIASPYVIEKLSGRKTKHIKPNTFWYKNLLKHYISTGSILGYANKNSVVWGSGIISRDDTPGPAHYRCVRGPLTRQRLLGLGYTCPEKYGDPALLFPRLHNPPVKKTFAFGVIPHYTDQKWVQNLLQNEKDLRIIDVFTTNPETVVDALRGCQCVISSSLHGLIFAHAYGIPAVWVKFENKLFGDNVKFYDYFASVKLSYPEEFTFDMHSLKEWENICQSASYASPLANVVLERQNDLWETFPFAVRFNQNSSS